MVCIAIDLYIAIQVLFTYDNNEYRQQTSPVLLSKIATYHVRKKRQKLLISPKFYKITYFWWDSPMTTIKSSIGNIIHLIWRGCPKSLSYHSRKKCQKTLSSKIDIIAESHQSLTNLYTTSNKESKEVPRDFKPIIQRLKGCYK